VAYLVGRGGGPLRWARPPAPPPNWLLFPPPLGVPHLSVTLDLVTPLVTLYLYVPVRTRNSFYVLLTVVPYFSTYVLVLDLYCKGPTLSPGTNYPPPGLLFLAANS